MRKHHLLLSAAAAACALAAAAPKVHAAEAAFGTYGLGGNAFGAGVTPPAGTYVTTSVGYYNGAISGPVPFQSVILNFGAKVKFFSSALDVLCVPDRKVFGGNLGLSVAVPVGHAEFAATVGVGAILLVPRGQRLGFG